MPKNNPSIPISQGSFASDFLRGSLYRDHLPQSSHLSFKFRDQHGVSREATSLDQVPDGVAYRPKLLMGLDTVPFCNDQFEPDSTPYIQRAKFYADKIIVYPEALEKRQSSAAQLATHANLTRGDYNGYISKSSCSKIRQNLEGWVKSVTVNRSKAPKWSNPKHSHITFPTLTLPSDQVHDDRDIKRKVLMPFIQKLKREHGIQEYFWKAEKQGNGNIHFHLFVDRYIDKDQLNLKWNVTTNALGYLDRYVARTGDHNPPSTKINVCPDQMSLVKYLMKYVTKSPTKCYPFSQIRTRMEYPEGLYEFKMEADGVDQVVKWQKVEGRCWGMSDGIRKAKVYSPEVSYRVRDLISLFEWEPSVRFVKLQYCEIYYCNVADILARFDKVLHFGYQGFYLRQYRQLYQGDPWDVLQLLPLVEPLPRSQPPPSCPRAVQLRFAC